MMKQDVNLYLPEFRVRKDPLTARAMLVILAAVIGLQLLISSWHLVNGALLRSELEDLQATLVEETRKTAELDDVLARRSENSALTARLETAEERLNASRQIRDFLSSTTLGNTTGFSEYFKDLSRALLDGLSLSEFTFSEGGAEVRIAGEVRNSALVPRYVDELKNGQSALSRRRFSPDISRAEAPGQLFSFALSTSNSE